MPNRFLLAEELLNAFVAYFRESPPDISNIRMMQRDFSRGFPDGIPGGTGEPDMDVRNFLLCNDLSDTDQKGLVVFINNAESVFDARSNDSGQSRSLDSFAAEYFGNVKVGVRFVTMTSLAKYFERRDWWREDVLELSPPCVTWSDKSKPCFVLTKLKHKFRCKQCNYESNVVDFSGRLQGELVDCVFNTKAEMLSP